MIYVVSGVHEGTHYKAKFHGASNYKLCPVTLQFLFFFISSFLSFFFFTEYHFTLIIWIDGHVQTV